MGKIILSIVLVLFYTASSFGSRQSGDVRTLQVRASDGLTFFYITMSVRDGVRPACATGDYWIIADENSESGKKQYAMLLAATVTGREIRVIGSGDCTRWINGEDIDSISLLP